VELKKEGCCPFLEPLATEARERRFVFITDPSGQRDKAAVIGRRRGLGGVVLQGSPGQKSVTGPLRLFPSGLNQGSTEFARKDASVLKRAKDVL
jgi:hypothetical protein